MVETIQDQRFEERAAIMEFDGGFNRQDAEWYAWFLAYGDKIIREEWFEERAAIMEFDGRLSRRQAESKANQIVYGDDRLEADGYKHIQGFGRPRVRFRERSRG